MTRIAIIKKNKCKAPQDCDYLCRKFCPRVRTGDKTITVDDETRKPVIDEATCVGCGICVKKCDFEAITIINTPQELDKPIHQFGVNGFRIFGLPVPQEGQVVGLIGGNGIGKTTAIEILAGKLIPNFGDTDKTEGTIDAVVEHFSKTPLRAHFEKIRDNKLRISIKPQNVSLISKKFGEDTVEDFLKAVVVAKTENPKRVKKLCETLDIGKIMKTKVKSLSGGELQRLAVAAALSKDADLYFIDEPSSYLDITQRLNAARAIRATADEGKSVVIVEHDLAMLDYVADLVHLFFGKEGAFGLVSLTKNQRTGINVYLSGYSKDENMRFRDEAIKFTEKAPAEIERKKQLVSFKDLKKTLGKFTVEAASGTIMQKEVIGVVGPNGIGKTTFVRLFSGELEPDSGTFSQKLTISHKPQYISPSRHLVRSVLRDAEKQASDISFDSTIVGPLGLRELLNHRLDELSGGELQRVSIAVALSQKADLYLIDEPSAFLDVEQRISTTKVIKRVMEARGKTALVVEHDILFLDYLADRLLVFDGIPTRHGECKGPMNMRDGMNSFLSNLGITMRRDPESKRPRINKTGSKLDQEQKSSGNYYYQPPE